MTPTNEYSKIAFFDFDGTITTRDTFLHFIFFVKGKLFSFLGFVILSPILFIYLIKLISNEKAKELVFSYFFKDTKESYLKEKGIEFASLIDKMLCVDAIIKINWHKSQNHKIVVVTASSNLWVEAWCIQNKLELISTSYETLNGILTGKISGKNCHGIEKVNRIKEIYDLSDYEDIYAYGDTKGDLPMLQIANYSYYCKF